MARAPRRASLCSQVVLRRVEGEAAMKEFEDILGRAALIAITVLAVLAATRIAVLWRSRRDRGPLREASRGVTILHLLGLVGLASLGTGLVLYLYVLLTGSAFMPPRLKAGLVVGLGILLAAGIIAHLWPRLPARRSDLVLAGGGALASGAIGLFLIASFVAASGYPAEGRLTLLDLPFEGEWVATGAGASAQTNHHHRIASQRYAVDIAKACNDGRLFTGEGKTLEESCTFGATVLAPVDGIVSHVRDGLPDRGSKQELAGNHVVIRLDEGRYVALAHLQQHSITVATGDPVRSGQPIARAGNSGNSDIPHLHVHVQDGPDYDLRNSTSIPFRFRDVQVKRYFFWRSVDAAALLRNDRVRSQP